jgi:acetyl esterase/lipase
LRLSAYRSTVIAEIFASDLDAVVIGVDYRLAPENKFPAPLDDCVETVNWVRLSSDAT